MKKKKPITWLLSFGSIIDEKEIKKTGIGLIFVGIHFIIVSAYLVISDLRTSDFNLAYLVSFFSLGVILIIPGEILRKGYFR